MADKEVKIRITTDASGAITGFKTVRDEVDKTEKHSASFSTTIKQHWVGIAAAAASIGAAWATVSKAIDFVKLGASAQQAEESFKRVGASAGYSTEQMEKYSLAMKKASAGTVDDSDAMQKAVKGMALGLKPDDIVKLMEAARRGARLTGEDVKSVYEKITDSIATGMPKALKQYGLATTEQVAIVKAAVKAGVEDVNLLEIALLNAAIQAEKMGTLAVTNAEKIQIFNAKVNDVKEQLGIMAITIIDNLLPAMGLLERELQKDAGATWGKKFALALIPIEAEVLRLYGLLQQLGGLLAATRMYLTGPGSALGIDSSKKRFESAAKDYLEYEKNYYDTDKALVALAQKEMQLRNELSGKGGKTAGGGADKGSQEKIKSLEGKVKVLEDRLKKQTALATGKQTPGEKGTESALDAARKAASELSAIGKSQYDQDIARIELQADKYREAGVGKIAVAKYVAAQTALADAKNTEAMTKKWRQAAEESQSAMQTEIDAAVRQTEESIKSREKFEQYAKESADVLLTNTEHAMADIMDEEKKKYDYLAKLEADGVITHREAEEEKRKATEKRIKSEKEIETDKFMKVNQDQQDIARNAADAFSALGALYAEDSKERQKLSNLSKAATIAEIALQVQKNLMIAVGAVVTQGTGDPYSAFARIAAMITVVTGVLSIVGIAFGGGGASAAAPPTPLYGNTTVLGGEYGQASESLTNSMDMVEEALDNIFNVEDVKLTKIYNELRSLNSNLTGLVSSIYRTGEVTDWNAEQTLNAPNTILRDWLNSWMTPVSQVINNFMHDLFGKNLPGNQELVWNIGGIKMGSPNVGTMAGGGDSGAKSFQEWQTRTTTDFWREDSYDTHYQEQALAEETQRLFNRVYKNIADTLLMIGDALCVSEEQIKAYTFSKEKINLAGKSQEEINKTLQEYFSKISDQAVDALFGNILRKYQEAGEGLYETAARIVVDKMTVLNMLEMTTKNYGNDFEKRLARFVGSAKYASDWIIQLSEDLIELAGGLENLTDYATAYYESFTSDMEKMMDTQKGMRAVFADMGMALPGTRDAYRAVVDGLDLSTKSGKEAYITLLRLSEQADDYYSSLEDLLQSRSDMEIDLLELQGKAAEALAKERENELKETNDLLKPLQEMIYAQQDLNDLMEKAGNLIKTWRSLEAKLLELQGDKTAVLANRRANELEALDESLRPLQELIYAQEDLNTARANEITAVGNLIAAHEKVVSEFKGYVDKLKAARESMQMEGLTYQMQEATAAKFSFAKVLEQARMGDFSGIGTIDNSLNKMVANANSPASFRTKQEYEANFYKTYNSIAELESLTNGQLTIEEQTLDTLKEQLKVLNQIAGNSTGGEMTVAEAEAAANAASADVATKQTILDAAKLQYEASRQAFVDMEAVVKAYGDENAPLTMSITGMTTALIDARQSFIDATTTWNTLLTNITAYDAAVEQNRLNELKAKQDAEAKAIADAKAAEEARKAAEQAAAEAKIQQTAAPKPLTGFTVLTKEQLAQIPAGLNLASGWSTTPMTFASGGDFAGGYRVVGEQGPELEYTGPSQIISNDKSKFLLNYKELLQEVNALRSDLNAANFQLVKNTNKNLKIAERWDAMFERWDVDGIPEERTT